MHRSTPGAALPRSATFVPMTASSSDAVSRSQALFAPAAGAAAERLTIPTVARAPARTTVDPHRNKTIRVLIEIPPVDLRNGNGREIRTSGATYGFVARTGVLLCLRELADVHLDERLPDAIGGHLQMDRAELGGLDRHGHAESCTGRLLDRTELDMMLAE